MNIATIARNKKKGMKTIGNATVNMLAHGNRTTTAVFGKTCKQGFGAPEPCLLEDMGFTQEDIEPFGFDQDENREILVWHTKTMKPRMNQAIQLNFREYAVEI
ncbi:hypothetical protein ANCDUO_10897 [Ancylostoma duodenale]|uniref:Uncharacterized protein n=1 Tax=Ancylostoma duodenale TaxID=51022 RepID=A0A0C2D9J1_9BILA|nr:hypothetical protein ANCDUO_10897 [Ancylostoma duodenale]